MENIYDKCPIYIGEYTRLRRTMTEDAEELIQCYSDEKALKLFNSDNCNGDDFHYTDLEKMRKGIEFWNYSYHNRYFVRWTIIHKDTEEKIGTVEMFYRDTDDNFKGYGILRIDIQSKYEEESILEDIINIANKNFYEAFGVKGILTKAIPQANKRIESLRKMGYKPLCEKLGKYDYYYVRN